MAMMDEQLKKIIKKVMEEEEYFRKLYRECAEKIETPSVKKLLKRLSEEEQQHKNRLESMDMSRICSAGEKRPIDIGKEIMLTPIDEFKEVKDALKFALRAEIGAKQKYLKLARSVEDKDAKELFECLAQEEKSHEELLKKELESLGI
ncbi:hypothetical protein GF351_02200 [Candidatus Woesearchaeota archaeon]|nr:hypothetical protein [Candidatus Woesearchaeota archaeon]